MGRTCRVGDVCKGVTCVEESQSRAPEAKEECMSCGGKTIQIV
jgi:hypothetical protein